VQLSPLTEDKTVTEKMDFNYHRNTDPQTGCPVVAHIRKTNPRDDLATFDVIGRDGGREDHSILRRGIPFGPEVTRREWIKGESANNLTNDKPDKARGLLFVSYQSRLDAGFRFMQQRKSTSFCLSVYTGHADIKSQCGPTDQPSWSAILGTTRSSDRPQDN
jgi:deferrochelatase/peroxidase EfeB